MKIKIGPILLNNQNSAQSSFRKSYLTTLEKEAKYGLP